MIQREKITLFWQQTMFLVFANIRKTFQQPRRPILFTDHDHAAHSFANKFVDTQTNTSYLYTTTKFYILSS